MNINAKQVGGTHYQSEYPHWDWVVDTGMGYLAGCATKYVSRWRKKGGLQDLQKALHYVNKLIEVSRDPRFEFDSGYDAGYALNVNRFAAANGLGPQEFDFCFLLMRFRSVDDLLQARELVLALMDQVDQVDPLDPHPVPLEDSNKHAPRT